MHSSTAAGLLAHVRAQWAGFLALFLVIAGGTAYAVNTIGSADVIDNSLQSVDLKNNQVRGVDAQNESLTGADIKDQSGVDTCVLGARVGQLCVRAENLHRRWQDAGQHCANIDLRLPTYSEALELAATHDIPDVDEDEHFWTQDFFVTSENRAMSVDDTGDLHFGNVSAEELLETLCVTTPTN
jgi:hypothetical protein